MLTSWFLAVLQLVVLDIRPASAFVWGHSVPKLSTRQGNGSIWALIVVGSNDDVMLNYASQSTACHAYQVLRERGVPADHIITMMWDDIAHASWNPYPGKIFNAPDMKDVYKSLRVDYKGKDVTLRNIIAVVTGNRAAVRGGNGRVLESTENDRVFLNFVSHGDVGIFCVFEKGGDFTQIMKERQRYGQLTFYTESCHSGSMFNTTPTDMKVYAMTSSKPNQLSWADFCPEEKDCGTHPEHPSAYLATASASRSEPAGFKTQKRAVLYGMDPPPLRYVPGYGGINETLSQMAANDPNRLRIDNFLRYVVEHITRNRRKQDYALMHVPNVISDLDCHHELVHAFKGLCTAIYPSRKDPYALKFASVMTNLCNLGMRSKRVVQRLEKICSVY